VVRSIHSACSDPGRRDRFGQAHGLWESRRTANLLRAALMLSVTAPVLIPPAAWAEPRWRQGVFPVASFAGYTSHFGQRSGPGGRLQPHYGVDIAAPMGSPIHNWWGGVVQDVINDGTCGLGLVISSGPYEHIYCHLSGSVVGAVYRSGPVALAAGSRVQGGQLIGHVGMSGRTTGPHLHWGIRHGGRWLNPGLILRAMAAARRR
jgi:murein DD-endopeptidase MepM/ murein hydrolase activator NlpD